MHFPCVALPLLSSPFLSFPFLCSRYMSYQIASGAQIMQLFDSWAHHLSPAQFERFSLPYIERAIAELRRRHPDTPLAVYVNGCGGKLDVLQRTCTADVVGVDWGVTMQDARQAMGSDRTLQVRSCDPSPLPLPLPPLPVCPILIHVSHCPRWVVRFTRKILGCLWLRVRACLRQYHSRGLTRACVLARLFV